MDCSLLKNKVYLILLAFYNNTKMPSFIQLSKDIGISRQTASTKFKELLNQNLIILDDNNCIFVNNVLNIDVNKLKDYLNIHDKIDIIELKNFLFGASVNKVELAKELKIARSSLYLDNHSVVYGILSEGRIKYIGTTDHFEDRIEQHIKKRPFLTPQNFIILKDNIGKDGFNIELELIHLLEPEWNKMGKLNENG